MFLKPDRLKKGDKIGIFLPSSPIKNTYRIKGLDKIRDMGFIPVEVKDILSRDGYRAKKPEDGIGDIQKFLSNKEITMLWAARGGYGSNYLLPLLSKLNIVKPKIIIGSSDVSYLLWYILDRFQMTVFYGPMPYSSLVEERVNVENFLKILSGNYREVSIPGNVMIHGKTKGIITGGCLSNFVSLMGTKFFPVVNQRILLLEDTNEKPYKLDRMIWQVFTSRTFSKIKGLIFGEFPSCFKSDNEKKSFFSRVNQLLDGLNIPVIYNLPFGHSKNIFTLPLGVEVEIDTTRFNGLIIKESGVR